MGELGLMVKTTLVETKDINDISGKKMKMIKSNCTFQLFWDKSMNTQVCIHEWLLEWNPMRLKMDD